MKTNQGVNKKKKQSTEHKAPKWDVNLLRPQGDTQHLLLAYLCGHMNDFKLNSVLFL